MTVWGSIIAGHVLLRLFVNSTTPEDEKDISTHCNANIVFCLYSDGSATDASTLRAVEDLCRKDSGRGRPVGFDYSQVEEEMNSFAKGHSLSNVVLNAIKAGQKWTWNHDKTEVKMSTHMKEKGELLIYETGPSKADKNYVACMTDCKAKYVQSADLGGDTKDLVQSTGTVDGCKSTCDQNKECEGFDVVESESNSCHLFLKKDIALAKRKKTTHYKIDRSVKTVFNCIGSIFSKPEISKSAGFIDDLNLPGRPWKNYLFICAIGFGGLLLIYAAIKGKKNASGSSE